MLRSGPGKRTRPANRRVAFAARTANPRGEPRSGECRLDASLRAVTDDEERTECERIEAAVGEESERVLGAACDGFAATVERGVEHRGKTGSRLEGRQQ